MSDYKIELSDISKIKKSIKIAIVRAEFNADYTKQLVGVNEEFLHSLDFKNTSVFHVPGAFEIPGMVKRLLNTKEYDLILAFWVVIRWATPHFDYVCSESARGLMNLSMKFETPIINGILTCNEEKQVSPRIGIQFATSGLNLLAECKKI